MPLTHDEIEAAIAEASAAMDLDPSLKGTIAAREFGANYTRLMARRRVVLRRTRVVGIIGSLQHLKIVQ